MRAVCNHAFLSVLLFVATTTARATSPVGYYRQPALYQDTLVFVSEGDLWKVRLSGGVATRLTSHPGEESLPAISPDGQALAFVASYEGPSELYTMPLSGGTPRRRTYDGGYITFVAWTPDGRILYATNSRATLPNHQLITLDIRRSDIAGVPTPVPLAQAADGCYEDMGATVFFTRLPFQGSHTKRYQGGTAQNLWKFSRGDAEAQPLTPEYAGTSKRPMWWQGCIYFASDRDGTMNIWSMSPDGSDRKQLTHHSGWDVQGPCLQGGRIVYQLGADIHLFDIAKGRDQCVSITLDSDLDQDREHWVKKPIDYLTAAHPAPDGERVVFTARGRVFVAPARQGRLVETAREEGVRYRDARFLPDGRSLLVLSDKSGEVELWRLPANGVGSADQLTNDGKALRWEAIPSPDGRWIAHHDKNQRLFLIEIANKTNRKIDESAVADFADLRWSPDGKWLAYVITAENLFRQIKLYSVADGQSTLATGDRFDSYSPTWSPDGKWLYFLSDRNLRSLVNSPWGNYQPEPFFDKKTKIYHLALTEALRSPFASVDELNPEPKDPEKEPDKKTSAKGDAKPVVPDVKIDRAGIQDRLYEVPVPPGTYSHLEINDKVLFWLALPAGESRLDPKTRKSNEVLQAARIARENVEVKTVVSKVERFELAQDGKKLLVHKEDKLYFLDPVAEAAELSRKDVDLSHWTLSVQPREEWRQMFVEAWRLERDYFYDRKMHGIDWKAMFTKYRPLVDRVNSREELSDLIAQMVSELSALHIFVRGGDLWRGPDQVETASLGAVLQRDEAGGGYRVVHSYRTDPDVPEYAGPLNQPAVRVRDGDIIELINGTRTLAVPDVGQLLRGKADQQVLLRIKPAAGGASRDVVIKPIGARAAAELRYHEWEYTRRQQVEELGKRQIGYVHLQAMSGDNYTEWARGFYPVFHRKGLIIDMRHNQGGNIDSWLLSRLLRKAWFHWSQRIGSSPLWNMQYAFRGHVVVLCDEFTASDGEAFTEGVKRLGIGKVIGTRTWGGEIWLSFSNRLVDRGIASAAEFGVYGPEGAWLIEGHGVDPDITVDNLPHATLQGEDAQLKAAITFLQKQIEEKPITVPSVPRFPNKTENTKGK
jgi:tricorn protease